VEGGHRAVIFNRFTGVEQRVVGEGTHLRIPWVQKPIIYDVRTRPRTITSVTGTKDLQMVNLTLRVLSKPDKQQLPRIYSRLGVDYDERVLPSIGNEVLKAIVAQYNAEQLLTQREKVSRQIRETLTARAKSFDIELDDVSMTHLTFGREFAQAIEQKQVAQQEAERSRYIVAIAEQERQAAITRAEGESEAAALVSQALQESGAGFIQLRRIEAAREIAETLSKAIFFRLFAPARRRYCASVCDYVRFSAQDRSAGGAGARGAAGVREVLGPRVSDAPQAACVREGALRQDRSQEGRGNSERLRRRGALRDALCGVPRHRRHVFLRRGRVRRERSGPPDNSDVLYRRAFATPEEQGGQQDAVDELRADDPRGGRDGRRRRYPRDQPTERGEGGAATRAGGPGVPPHHPDGHGQDCEAEPVMLAAKASPSAFSDLLESPNYYPRNPGFPDGLRTPHTFPHLRGTPGQEDRFGLGLETHSRLHRSGAKCA